MSQRFQITRAAELVRVALALGAVVPAPAVAVDVARGARGVAEAAAVPGGGHPFRAEPAALGRAPG